MATPSEIMGTVAALENDVSRDVYTDAAVLPYFNIALRRLQEKFQVNDIPVTKEVSSVIVVPANTRVIGKSTTPALPTNLVEIKQIWESPTGLSNWTPLTKRDFIPHYLDNPIRISQFLMWAWIDQEITVLPASAIIDLKLNYIKNLFTTILISGVNTNIDIIGVQSFLEFKTAAYCAAYIGENEARASALDAQADDALNDSLGISTKGRQSIFARRRPFRSAFKSRTMS